MSRVVGIFVQKPSGSAEEFAAEVSRAIGVPLFFDGEDSFENMNEERLIYAHENDLEDEPGMPFSRYRFVIDVRSKPAKTQDQVVAKIYSDMKSKTPYPLLVVEDAERVIDRRD